MEWVKNDLNIPLFTLVCFMNIHIWRLFLRNMQRMCKKVNSAMTRYRRRDRASLYCHSTIASSSSCHRTIVMHRVIAPSRHHFIDPNSLCDGTMENWVALSGFHATTDSILVYFISQDSRVFSNNLFQCWRHVLSQRQLVSKFKAYIIAPLAWKKSIDNSIYCRRRHYVL